MDSILRQRALLSWARPETRRHSRKKSYPSVRPSIFFSNLEVFMAACISIASRPSVRSVSFFSNLAKLVALDMDIPSSRVSDSAVYSRFVPPSERSRSGSGRWTEGGEVAAAAVTARLHQQRRMPHLCLSLGRRCSALHCHALQALHRLADLLDLLGHGQLRLQILDLLLQRLDLRFLRSAQHNTHIHTRR